MKKFVIEKVKGSAGQEKYETLVQEAEAENAVEALRRYYLPTGSSVQPISKHDDFASIPGPDDSENFSDSITATNVEGW